MNVAQTTSVFAASGIGGGWWIGVVLCMLMMGVMMFGMMRHGRAEDGGTRWWRERWWSDRAPGSREETPSEVLDRRFAEGEISVEDYRERRAALTHAARGRQDGTDENGPVASEASRKEEP